MGYYLVQVGVLIWSKFVFGLFKGYFYCGFKCVLEHTIIILCVSLCPTICQFSKIACFQKRVQPLGFVHFLFFISFLFFGFVFFLCFLMFLFLLICCFVFVYFLKGLRVR